MRDDGALKFKIRRKVQLALNVFYPIKKRVYLNVTHCYQMLSFKIFIVLRLRFFFFFFFLLCLSCISDNLESYLECQTQSGSNAFFKVGKQRPLGNFFSFYLSNECNIPSTGGPYLQVKKQMFKGVFISPLPRKYISFCLSSYSKGVLDYNFRS